MKNNSLTPKVPTPTLPVPAPADAAEVVHWEAYRSNPPSDSAQRRRKISTDSNTKAKIQRKFAALGIKL
jgi:hypothetical protein